MGGGGGLKESIPVVLGSVVKRLDTRAGGTLAPLLIIPLRAWLIVSAILVEIMRPTEPGALAEGVDLSVDVIRPSKPKEVPLFDGAAAGSAPCP